MPQELYSHSLPNGMTLLAERMPTVRSAAFQFMVPAGAVYDPPDRLGLASLVTDLISRGAGERDSRAFSDALDRLGVDRSETTGLVNLYFSGVLLARNLPAALALYADMLRRPRMPEDELDAAKALGLQDIQGLEDEPQSKVMTELSKHHYPMPLCRDRRGTVAGIEPATIDDLLKFRNKHVSPTGTVLAIAGDIDWPRLKADVDRLFGDWEPRPSAPFVVTGEKLGSEHLVKDIEQTQIALAYPSVPRDSADYFAARGAMGILSLDMSSRLFMNIREKYGLCYSIYSNYEPLRDRGSIVCYTATRPESAQRILELMMHELCNLKNGIEADELERVQVGLKSLLILRQESTSSRASSMANDWYFLNRVTTVEEIHTAIEAMTVSKIIDYSERFPPQNVTLVTLGQTALTLPEAGA